MYAYAHVLLATASLHTITSKLASAIYVREAITMAAAVLISL